ncbi:MAG TPA: DinB family protein, partial [Candidatus Hydrogenedentes bacterium]|nr:DinB family protein [Candidatus Hydrogenedentota bacterium]
MEMATTRKVLERVPTEHLNFKPHPKSMSLGGLASH